MVKTIFTTCRNGAIAAAGLITLGGVSTPAVANPFITATFSSDYSASDIAVVDAALDFYSTNIINTFSMSIAFGSQAANTGATSIKLVYNGLSYASYKSALVANENSANASAVASLGSSNSLNPVNGTSTVSMSTVLAGRLNLAPSVNGTYSECGGATATACITVNSNVLSANNGGTTGADLTSLVEHEVDEVLGTSSALPNGPSTTIPNTPSAADLFRYGAPGVRSWSTNASTSVPCSGAPNAYFSVNGGVTDLSNYNNCANGGDYGDWGTNSTAQVQDAFSNGSAAPVLTLASTEVTLLEAVGYDFVAPAAVPEPASAGMLVAGVAVVRAFRRKRTA